CRGGATPGVDPQTNTLPAGPVTDRSTSSPVVLSDGSVLYGAYTRYNGSRGHLFKFGAGGDVLATYPFGWDITPAVRPHDATYSILLKENHYAVGSYCGDPGFCPNTTPEYRVVSLDAALGQEWSFTNTTSQACSRQPDGTIACVPADPGGFEWCVNQPAVDGAGVTHINSEDGYLYALRPNGTMVGRIFLDTALGAAYTPLSIGPDGAIYTQNNGRLFAVGKTRALRDAPSPPPAGARKTRVLERH
ncbi:MAG: hypothetical protein WAU32_01395, partial [Thermoanaerobaculia bacterium]